MKNKKIKNETYNDGYIYYGIIQIKRNDKKEKIGESFKQKGRLPFERCSIRDSDNLTADSLGYVIDSKIKVPYRELEKNIKIKINNEDTLYDVVKKDTTDRKKLYIYLQNVSNEKEG